MIKRTIAHILIACFFMLSLSAQNEPLTVFNCPVRINGTTLKTPFAGGLNCPQFSPCDLNNDGRLDLVLFDRDGDKVLTYLQTGTGADKSYVYAPEYAHNFPDDLRNFVVLRDFNKDGAMDIYTSSNIPNYLDLRVLKGYFENNQLKFRPLQFHYPNCVSCISEIIYYPSQVNPGLWNNLSIPVTDVPAIEDVDNDGDLDIVSFEATIGGYVYMWKNMAVERGFSLDSLKYELTDRCWGKFYESGLVACENALSGSPDTCSGPGFVGIGPDRHPGSTVLLYDQDGDGDKEVVLGDINFSCLNQMTNGGTPQNAWMVAQDVAFPSSDVSVEIPVFPAAFVLDLDFDGVKDMVVAPNNKSVQEDRKGVWFYKNEGSNSNYNFSNKSKTFLQGDMIDLGSMAHPAVADVNGDGLLDLVVGNFGYYQNGSSQTASMYLFLNSGTATQPAFRLEDTDWLGFSQFTPSDFDFSPLFADIDADGDMDLLVGGFSGSIYALKNSAGASNAMNFSNPNTSQNWFGIDIGASSSVAWHDMDCDGLPDMLLGERTGNINFFKNTGTSQAPIFSVDPTVKILGGISTTTLFNFFGFSTPAFKSSDCMSELISGSYGGNIFSYKPSTNPTDSFAVLSTKFGGIDVGDRSHPIYADLNGDGKKELIVGNQRGGIEIFNAEGVTSIEMLVESPSDIDLWPNPTHTVLNVLCPDKKSNTKWKILNALGQVVQQGTENEQQFTIDSSVLPTGAYWFQIETEGGLAQRVFVRN